MIPKVPVGPSTWAAIIAALGAAVAFTTEWASTGTAPTWLAGITAVLVAVLSITRSLQATFGTPYVTNPEPVEQVPPVEEQAA